MILSSTILLASIVMTPATGPVDGSDDAPFASVKRASFFGEEEAAAAVASSAASMAIEDLVAGLRAAGFEARDASADLTPADRDIFDSAVGAFGAATAHQIELSPTSKIDVVRFERYLSMVQFGRQLPEYLFLEGLIILPNELPRTEWLHLTDVISDQGGFRYSIADAQRMEGLMWVGSQRELLMMLTAAFQADNDRDPDFGGSQWQEVLAAADELPVEFIPHNPFVEPEVASRITVVETPGVDGSNFGPDEAGWVWNSADHKLYAAMVPDSMIADAARTVDRYQRIISFETRLPNVAVQLSALRSQIQLFTTSTGAAPDFETEQWQALIDAGFCDQWPINPLLPIPAAARLALVSTPGATGNAVSVEEAGWVWNTADQQLYAAGFSDEELQLAVERAPQSAAAFTRRAEARTRQAQLTIAVGSFALATQPSRFPTVDQLKTPGVVLPEVPRNPYNGSSEVQIRTFDSQAPAVGGDAGWNYDPVQGIVWVNSEFE